MSKGTWYFYDLKTGALSGRALTGPAELVEANTPAGHGAVEVPVGTVLNHRARRVDLQTGEVVPYQPPAPPDEELRSWAWDAEAERWLPVPTLAARRLELRMPVLQALASEDARAIRPMSEMLSALAGGESVPEDTKAALAGIEERKAGLREALRAIDQAESEPALHEAVAINAKR